MCWVFWSDISGKKVDNWEVDMGWWGYGEHVTQSGDELLCIYLRSRSDKDEICDRETRLWAAKDAKEGKKNFF